MHQTETDLPGIAKVGGQADALHVGMRFQAAQHGAYRLPGFDHHGAFQRRQHIDLGAHQTAVLAPEIQGTKAFAPLHGDPQEPVVELIPIHDARHRAHGRQRRQGRGSGHFRPLLDADNAEAFGAAHAGFHQFQIALLEDL